ncbi:MFS transporter [Halobacteriales archaeon QH_10_67_22]|nr:MAG: MFS transporter [Halobacteriales archaeon QH_10_67_22]
MTLARARLARLDALAVTAAIWFFGKFLRYAFPPLFETLGASYGVSRTVLGTAFTGFMLMYALLQFPSGLLADRVGPVAVVAAGGLVTTVGALALVVDAPFGVLVGAMVLMGAGTGVYKTASVELLSRVYHTRTGRALGVFDTTGSLAGAAAPAAVVVAAGLPPVAGAPWRTLFLVGGLAGLALVGALLVRVPRRLADDRTIAAQGAASDGGAQTSAGSVRAYLGLFGRLRFAAFVAVTVLFGFAYNGVVAFLPLYLVTEAGLPSASANLLFGALFAVSLVQLGTGEASDRVGRLPVLVATLGVATAGLAATLALSSGGGVLELGAAVVALGLGAHGFRPVRGAYLMQILPDGVAGGGLGAVRTLLMGAGAVGPAVVGYLSETVGFRAAFGLLAVALAGATGLTALLWTLE